MAEAPQNQHAKIIEFATKHFTRTDEESKRVTYKPEKVEVIEVGGKSAVVSVDGVYEKVLLADVK